ncbi:MAG: hypothetical protein EXR11_09155 [Rhodospirillaceae bacterium]|nr:hypothetical protein [Rhodospirillaceae bacterium]
MAPAKQIRAFVIVVSSVLGLLSIPAFGQAPSLGTIHFPTSAKPVAQAPFETGVKALYNFEFDQARVAFQDAGKADPDFALAAWGEAMSHNHPLWAEQNREAGLQALGRMGPTPAARAAKAPEGKERGLMQAIDVLYGEGDKLARDNAYAAAMGNLSKRFPDDDEIAVMHALSLLGTVRQGDTGFRHQMQAGAIAERVLRANPDHPGAAHDVIHSFDDPEHAPLSLWAARAYAKIAPDAPHALHMPSHIFVQLGMWEDVVASNTKAYAAADALATRMNLPRGREDFHALSWLMYGNLQLGKIDAAKANLQTARDIAKKDSSERVMDGLASMEARFVVETERWQDLPAPGEPMVDSKAETSGAHMNHAYDNNSAVQFALGLSAAKLGKLADAQKAEVALKAARDKLGAGAYRGKIIAVIQNQVSAAIAMAKKDLAGAESLLKEATATEASLAAPSGPPEIMKPSFESYGELLLAANRPAEAAAQFQQALLRTPNRAKSVQGLAKATAGK